MGDVKFVAEISSNHNGSLERCIQLIKSASEAGCDAVKFQLFKIDELFAPEILKESKTHRDRRSWELPAAFIPELAKVSHDLGLEFSCTPFYLDAIAILEPHVDFYKIASYELLWHDLFRKCAKTGLPIAFSTGMSTEDEVVAAVQSLQGLPTKDVTVLRCTSSYPTPYEEANLKSINTLEKLLQPFQPAMNISVGWSDHTVSPGVILRSIFTYNAKFIEFHFDLEGDGEEFGSGHCWLPNQIAPVIKMAKEGLGADGEGIITPGKSESPDRIWRADPEDGLRPFKQIRKSFRG